MFTDLVGSSALSTRLDTEDLRAVIGAYHKCVAETVARFDGFSTEARSAKVDASAAARHSERTLGLTSGILAEIAALAGVREISSAEADRLFAPYLDAIERLVRLIDGWNE
jgi:class 3 adenylate cyclase